MNQRSGKGASIKYVHRIFGALDPPPRPHFQYCLSAKLANFWTPPRCGRTLNGSPQGNERTATVSSPSVWLIFGRRSILETLPECPHDVKKDDGAGRRYGGDGRTEQSPLKITRENSYSKSSFWDSRVTQEELRVSTFQANKLVDTSHWISRADSSYPQPSPWRWSLKARFPNGLIKLAYIHCFVTRQHKQTTLTTVTTLYCTARLQ